MFVSQESYSFTFFHIFVSWNSDDSLTFISQRFMITIVRARLRLCFASITVKRLEWSPISHRYSRLLVLRCLARHRLFQARWWKLRWCWRVSQYVRLPVLYTFTAFRYLTSTPLFPHLNEPRRERRSRTPTHVPALSAASLSLSACSNR